MVDGNQCDAEKSQSFQQFHSKKERKKQTNKQKKQRNVVLAASADKTCVVQILGRREVQRRLNMILRVFLLTLFSNCSLGQMLRTLVESS